jgi:hypothetical protein
MTDSFATTIIGARIPLADVTPLEQLFLAEIFTCEGDGVHASYFAPEAPASVICPPYLALTEARWASAYTESRLNRFVIETLMRYGQVDTDVEIAVDRRLWETILQDIVRRSSSLPYVPVVTVYPAASPTDWGAGGDASFITADEVRSISTTGFLDDAIARFETGRAGAAA